MAKETKTVQVYPSDIKINAEIQRQELFGWEVISNQRVQEFTGQDSDGTKHYETFNKITFSREKSSEWYDRIVELETEYNLISLRHTKQFREVATYENMKARYGYQSEVDKFKMPEKVEKPKIAKFVPFTIKFVILIVLSIISAISLTSEDNFLVDFSPLFIIGAIVFFVLSVIDLSTFKKGLRGEEAKKAKSTYAQYKNELKEYNANTSQLINEFFKQRMNEIEIEAKKLVK